jgi:hypothetical protein
LPDLCVAAQKQGNIMEKKRSQRRTLTEMSASIKAWEQSGQSRAAFCRDQGIHCAVFQYWQRRCRPAAGFVEVQPPPQRTDRAAGCSICIKHPGGMEVALSGEISATFLREVLGW